MAATASDVPLRVQPYLYFEGRTDEALEFYKTTLGAEVVMLMRFKDMSQSQAPRQIAPETWDKVMHCAFRIGETTLMASDGRCSGKAGFQGVTLTLSVANAETAERLFARLGEGGQVQMPMAETFFSKRFGMVADKFGVSWMILVDQAASAATGKATAGSVEAVKPFIISRTLNAPRDRVWKAWTDRAQLMQWFGPKGVTIPVASMDLHPGGMFHYCMRLPDGKEMWGKWIFREVVAPERIVLTSSFSDPKGGVTRHPMSPSWPLETRATTTFTELDGKTTISVNWVPENASDAERATFDAGHESMKQGWGGTIDQLEAYLAKP